MVFGDFDQLAPWYTSSVWSVSDKKKSTNGNTDDLFFNNYRNALNLYPTFIGAPSSRKMTLNHNLFTFFAVAS